MIRRLSLLLRLLALLLIAVTATPVLAQGGMVSAADGRAAEAGRAMLRAGGSATDAAMAMMLALTVVEPQSSGIGGGGLLLHHDPETGALTTIDGRETAPAEAHGARFLTPDGVPLPFAEAFPGGRSVGVPGNIALMARAHARWGKLPWAQLFEPAIRLAEEGFEIRPLLASRIRGMATVWADFPEIRALYGNAQLGTVIHNPQLADTLRRIAAGGPEEFYRGATARAIETAVASAPRNPAALTAADLAAYAAPERPPLCGRYRGWKICGMGPPSSGATTVLGILGMLERFDLRRMGKDNPVAWHLIAEAMQLAYADRDRYLGDADFGAVPTSGLIDPTYLRQRAALIAPERARTDYPAGHPAGAGTHAAVPPSDEHGTTHFVAVDGQGEMVSMTSTVEGPFGSQLLAGGMVLNNELTDFSFLPERDGIPAANRVEPGKRPLSSMSPTIVYDRSGRPVLAIGSAGGRRIIMHVAKALIGMLDWQLPAQEAIALPNIFFRGRTLLLEQGTALEMMAPALAALGHTVAPAQLESKLNAIARVKGGWKGAADPRSEGLTLAE